MATALFPTETTGPQTAQHTAAAVIRGLPADLATVPENAAEWRVWRRAVTIHRIQHHQRLANNPTPQQIAAETELCRRDAAYFVVMWCNVFEPRSISAGLGGDGWAGGFRPFIPYAFQVRMIRTMDEIMTARGAKSDLAISKSRDMGATWVCCIWALHGYLFRPNFKAKLISRKEDLVDLEGDMDSMFMKIVSNMDRLPEFLMPKGFVWSGPKANRMRLRITHPVRGNEAAILGESTGPQSNRGGRSTVVIIDEGAFIPDFYNVWGTAANSTEHRIVISSESLELGDDFYRLQKAEEHERPTVLALDYYLHPEHDDEWLRNMKARFNGDMEKFEREVLRNPHAGFGGFVYPQARDIVPGDYPWEPGMALTIAIDPGWDDETAIVWLAYDPRSARYRLVHAYENRQEVPEFYADVILGQPPMTTEIGQPSFLYRANGIYDTEATMHWTWNTYGRYRNARPGIFGDPTGNQRHTGRGFYDLMEARWVQAEWPARIEYGTTNEQRYDQGRRFSLNLLLQKLDVNDTPECRAVLRALQETRMRSVRGGLSEQRKPEHDQGSHLRTALEYAAVNVSAMQSLSRMDLRPMRVSAARKGQRIGARA